MNREFNVVWKDFDQRLSEYICKKVNHQDECYDILQNVYVKVLTNINRIQKVENIGSYLFRIAGNEVINDYRSAFKYQEIGAVEPLLEESAHTEFRFQLADCNLRPFIDTLPAIYSEALILTELEGMSQIALAEKLGISVSGAKSRVQRAREKLKTAILQCCQYEFDRYGNILSCCNQPQEELRTA